LTDEQRDELGGVEYRALKALLWVLPSICPLQILQLISAYFFGLMLLSFACLAIWISQVQYYADILRADAIGGTWWSMFTTGSLFANVGYMQNPDGLISFQDAVFPLLLLAFMIVAGYLSHLPSLSN